MDLSQLRTLIHVAELGSLSKAADRMRIAQPALSRQMRLLEEELGVRLFVPSRPRHGDHRAGPRRAGARHARHDGAGRDPGTHVGCQRAADGADRHRHAADRRRHPFGAACRGFRQIPSKSHAAAGQRLHRIPARLAASRRDRRRDPVRSARGALGALTAASLGKSLPDRSAQSRLLDRPSRSSSSTANAFCCRASGTA
jgi:Bacterial regulatory helix-turn-helix protein, lysR family